jgi:predicted dehydrogenase
VRDTREQRLGWGVLGAAWIAGRAVLPAIEASRNGRLVAIASRDVDRAKRMAAQTSMRVSESYEALLADPEVDAVYIALVNSLHKDWTVRALAAQKHVLCEKPLAMNAAEAEEMAAAAASTDMHLMEAFMYRFHPRMRDFIHGLRDVLHVQASFGFTLEDRSNYRLRPELGGGALLDVGCYTVNVARWILGEPEEVLARARVDGVDMTVSALLEFSGGRTASLWASFESAEEQELTVVTSQGVHRLENPFTYAQEADQYQLMVESFADSVMQDRPVAIPPTESIANLKALDRIREAAGI